MEGFRSHTDWPYNLQPSSILSASATPFSGIRSASSDVSPPNPIHFPDHSQSYGDGIPIQSIPHVYDFFSDPVTEFDSSNPHSFGYSGLHVPPFSHFGQCSNTTKTSPVERQIYVPPYIKISPPHEAPNHAAQWSNTTKTSLVERKTYVPPYVNFSAAPPVFQNHTGQCSNTTKTSLVERKTYAPPYVPGYVPSSYVTLVGKGHDDTSSVVPNHQSSFSVFNSLDDYADYDKSLELGFAGQSSNQFAEFNDGRGKYVEVGGSFPSNQTNINNAVAEERMKRGYQLIKDNHGEFPHMIGTDKHSMPTSEDQFDDKSRWWETVKPAPVDFSGASVLQPSSFSVKTHQAVPLKLAVDSGDHHFSYTGVHNKGSMQQGVDMVFTTPMAGSGTDLNIGNIIADGDVGHYNFDDIEEAYPLPTLETASSFYLDNFHIPLERNKSSSNNSMISDMDSSRDALDYFIKERHGFQNPNPSLDNLSLRLNATEDVNSTDKSFVCGSLCNPAVDSPCWKGAPTACFAHEFSVALPPEHMHKNEEFVGSVIQEAQYFLPDSESNDKKSDDRSNNHQVDIGIVDHESSSKGSLEKFSVTKLASENFKSDGAVNAGHFQSESSCDYGLKDQDGVTEMKKTKPIDCKSGSSHHDDQVIKENKLVAQESHAFWTGSADVGCNENQCLESGTSFTAKPAQSSPSSVADAPTAPEKSDGNLNVQMLVNTMQNLSELLLNHCLNDACELKERDSDILKNVITNLETCVLKNAEQITQAQEFLLHQLETSRCAGERCELQQNVHYKRAQLARTEPEDSKVTFGPNLHFGCGKPQLKLLDFFPPRGDAEMTKTENMTKALKKILGENFDDESTECQSELYKNLWLEAEAALCSLNYRARYNQMKIEMEKHSYKQSDMEEQSKDEVTKVHNNPKSDSSTKGLPILDATNPKIGFKFSDENKPNLLMPDSLVQKYTVSGTNKEVAGSDEASIMARYHVLIGRGNTIDLEKPSDIADKSTAREIDNQNEVDFCQQSPIPGKGKADYNTAVLARFHILKSRVEDSSSVSSEEKWLDGVGSSGKGKKDSIITENASEDKSLDAHLNSYDTVEKSITKETHPDIENLFDWEHV